MALTQSLTILYDIMREDFDLVPALIQPARGGRPEKHWPNGGCHIHYGADLFDTDVNWYRTMERFHHNLIIDYANRPYIRWLLAQWTDNENSHCLVELKDFNDDVLDTTRESVLEAAIGGNCFAIEPRFMVSQKNAYLTFEFRFIDMAHTPEELIAVATLVDAWVQHILDHTLAEENRIELSITRKDLMDMSRPKSALRLVKSWLDSISISGRVRPVIENTLYERHYLNRIRHGKLV